MSGVGILLKKILRKFKDSKKVKVKDVFILDSVDGAYFIILLSAIFSMIPTPIPIPIISILFGLIILAIICQILANRKKLYIPDKVLNISFKKKLMDKVINKVLPSIRKLEIYVKKKKKHNEIDKKQHIFVLNVCILVSSLIMLLPISLISTIPAFAIIVICFGIINKNKLFTNIGIFLTILSIISIFAFYFIGKLIYLKFARTI